MTDEEFERMLQAIKAANIGKTEVRQTMIFNAPIGQHISHVDKIVANFDKNMGMTVENVNEIGLGTKESNHENNVPLTEEELKRKVELVLPLISAKKHYFSVCRYMMWRKMVAERDFTSAVNILEKLFPGLNLDAKDMDTYYVQSFRKRTIFKFF